MDISYPPPAGSVTDAFDVELWTDTLSAYRDEYKGLAETWYKLDTKAQGTATIAGVFLAAVFASSRIGAMPTGLIDRLLLAGSVLFLVASVVYAGIALRVQTVPGGPPGSEIERAANGARTLVDRGTSAPEVRSRFLASQAAVWRRCASELRDRTSRKAASLRWAQRLIFVGAFSALVVTLHTLVVAPRS